MKQTKTLNHSHKEKNYISGSFSSMINSLYSSFLFHYQNREHFSTGPDNLLFDIVPLLIIEQISKTCSFIPAPTPPFPSSQTDSHDAMPWLFSFNCLMSSIVFMHSHIFLLPCGLYSAFLGPEYEKKYQTKNKPMASFSILHCNLIIWYKHFIVSKLFEWFDIEMRSAVFVPSWTQGFPFTRLH